MRPIHADARDGGVRSPFGLPKLRGECAAGPVDRAALLGRLSTEAHGARDQRTQRRCATHPLSNARFAWRRMHMLLRSILAPRQARQGWHQEFPEQPAVDDLALRSSSSNRSECDVQRTSNQMTLTKSSTVFRRSDVEPDGFDCTARGHKIVERALCRWIAQILGLEREEFRGPA
jgi:hypothetical protein